MNRYESLDRGPGAGPTGLGFVLADHEPIDLGVWSKSVGLVGLVEKGPSVQA